MNRLDFARLRSETVSSLVLIKFQIILGEWHERQCDQYYQQHVHKLTIIIRAALNLCNGGPQ